MSSSKADKNGKLYRLLIVCIYLIWYINFVVEVHDTPGPIGQIENYADIEDLNGATSSQDVYDNAGNITNQRYDVAMKNSSHAESEAEEGDIGLKNGTFPDIGGQRHSVMIIAVYPKSFHAISAIWSQLECFADQYEKIIISYQKGNDQINDALFQLWKEVWYIMPNVAKRIEFHVDSNEMYDTGLWCNALTQESVLQKGPNGNYVGGNSLYSDFLLINDSVMALEHSSELREAIYAKGLDMAAFSYWNEDKEQQKPFWVESYARAFSQHGMQIFADKFCFRKKGFSWREYCPDMYVTEKLPTKQKAKKCIVRLTEVEVASMYNPHKVHGIYPGRVPIEMVKRGNFTRSLSWTGHYPYWSEILRDTMKFPVVKASDKGFLLNAMSKRPEDFAQCTKNMDEEIRLNLQRPFMSSEKLLWFGEHNTISRKPEIHILEVVVAYCKSNLDWMHNEVLTVAPMAGITDVRMTIISKCGNEENIPDFAQNPLVTTTNVLPLINVGGCDYAYATFINSYVSQHSREDMKASVILFIKDTPRDRKSFHFRYHRGYREIDDMIKIAKKRDFVCGIKTACDISPYHHTETLQGFTLGGYTRINDRKEGQKVRGNVTDDFNIHGYTNLGDFTTRALNWTFPNDVTPVCYGGTFAIPGSRLMSQWVNKDERGMMKIVEKILSRNSTEGTTLEEHFMERVWASLFSPILTKNETSQVQKMSDKHLVRQFSIYGILHAPGNLCYV